MRKKSDGIELPDGQVYDIIPPLPTSSQRGGIVANEKTTESLEVVIDSSTGKAYVEDVGETIMPILNNKYEKPSGGIPNTDLSSAVQTSLSKINLTIGIGSENLLNPFTMMEHTIIGSSGQILTNPAYYFDCYTDIEVKPETTYTLQKKVNDAFLVYVAYYKSDDTFISRQYFTTSYNSFQFTTPALTDHIAICYQLQNNQGTVFYDFSELMLSENSTRQDYKAFYKISDGFNQEFDKNRLSFSAFKKFGVIGDSLSVGYNYDKDNPSNPSLRNIDFSWGQAVARLYGNSCVNMGKAGITTAQWLEDQDYGIGVLQADGNKCQAYVIGIGINDVVDTSSRATFKTNYQAIVNAVKTENPRAKIFCITMTMSSNYELKNEVIKEVVADNSNVYLIDIAEEFKDVFDSQMIRDYYLGNHYTAGGYVNIGMVLSWIISNVMDKNADDFWDVYKIEYDAPPEKQNKLTYVADINQKSMWESGVINSSGADATNLNRIRTKTYIPQFESITCESGYEYAIVCYDSNDTVKPTNKAYFDFENDEFVSNAVYSTDEFVLAEHFEALGNYTNIRLILRRTETAVMNSAESAAIHLNKTTDGIKGLDYYSESYGGGIIENVPNPLNPIWTQWNGRLAFGKDTNTAPVPYNVLSEAFIKGTIINYNTGERDFNRWGYHLYEGYSADHMKRLTMLIDKHDNEFYNKDSAEIYNYTGSDHTESSYGNVKIGSDVKYHSFLFSRDKMRANGVIDMGFPLQLARLGANDIDTTYSTVAQADEAYEPEGQALANVKCLKGIAIQNAENGAMYYDGDNDDVKVKVDDVWENMATEQFVTSNLTPNSLAVTVFYALAIIAGDSTQGASQNPPGQYTDNAKKKIQEMIGILSVEEVEF